MQNHENDDDESPWEEWDICRSLFDNYRSPSMDLNLEYMYRRFGFYFPDAEYLKDPEGLLKYLVITYAY
jgi:pre-60S factor REI1